MFYLQSRSTVLVIALFSCSIVLAGCADSPQDARDAVRSLLMTQQNAWNAGDIESFMEGYLKSDAIRFASSGGELRGWEPLLARYYRSYPDRAAMGTLTFDLKEIRVLSAQFVFVFGSYALEREFDRPTGLFTLLAENTSEGWKVIHDHTSADEIHTSSD